MATPW
jgi:hypothetical protein